MNFGQAVEALKEGKKVCREGWNGKGMFIFKQVPCVVDVRNVPYMQVLPESVKAEFVKRGNPISYSNQMCIVTANNRIDSWVPSSSDTLSDDWLIVD